MTVGRGANISYFDEKTITSTGGQSAITMSGLDDAKGRWGSSTTFVWGALVQVDKEYASRRIRQHREVNLISFKDNGAGGPPAYVADVRQASTNCVSSGSSPFAETMRRPSKTFGEGGRCTSLHASICHPETLSAD